MEESLSRKQLWWVLALLVTLFWFSWSRPILAQAPNAGGPDGLFGSAALAWLVLIGLGMLACGTVPPERVPTVMRVGWLALGLSVIGYWLCGFAFQFGGVGLRAGPELAGLAREWTLSGMEGAWGSQWGVIGLEGYLLRGPAGTPAALRLFWSQLPWITTSVAVALWAVQARTWPVGSAAQRPATSGLGVLLVLTGLLQAALYTLVGNWVWGGGWLAYLGENLGLGRGFADYGGSLVHLLAASVALAALVALPAPQGAASQGAAPRSTGASPQAEAQQLPLPELDAPVPGVRWTARDEPYVPMPALHLPVLATAGAWLALIGWLGWCTSTPLHGIASVVPPWPEQAIGLLLAAAGGALSALFASWLTTRQGNALMTARGVIAALIAVSAGLPSYPLSAALAVGGVAGLLVPLAQYAVDHLLHLHDVTSVLAAHGLAALWGLLAVGLWGGGGPGQFQAQAFGVAAIVCLALLAGGLLMGLARGLVRAWHGESLPRRVVRPARPRRARLGRARPQRKALAAVRWPEWRRPDWGRLVPARLKNLRWGRTLAGQEGAEAEAAAPAPEPVEEGAEPPDLTVADVGEVDAGQEPAASPGEGGP